MIDTVVNTVTDNIDPLSFVIGLAFGVLADEAGRKVFRKMVDNRINQMLGRPCSCDECNERINKMEKISFYHPVVILQDSEVVEGKLSSDRMSPSDSEGGKN